MARKRRGRKIREYRIGYQIRNNIFVSRTVVLLSKPLSRKGFRALE
ncbi:MAG: hypothetical protein RQ885_00090 [Desulfurococcales archaeon]|jgi:hypothetical protein|nr:hypothetical protein [Desulfurococcales archaeon]